MLRNPSYTGSGSADASDDARASRVRKKQLVRAAGVATRPIGCWSDGDVDEHPRPAPEFSVARDRQARLRGVEQGNSPNQLRRRRRAANRNGPGATRRHVSPAGVGPKKNSSTAKELTSRHRGTQAAVGLGDFWRVIPVKKTAEPFIYSLDVKRDAMEPGALRVRLPSSRPPIPGRSRQHRWRSGERQLDDAATSRESISPVSGTMFRIFSK